MNKFENELNSLKEELKKEKELNEKKIFNDYSLVLMDLHNIIAQLDIFSQQHQPSQKDVSTIQVIRDISFSFVSTIHNAIKLAKQNKNMDK